MSFNFNKVIIGGNLTKDPEVKYTQSGKVVCQFTLAVNDGYGDKQTTQFVPIVVWGKIGELCGNSLVKGSRALVDGRLQIRSYEAKDGSGKRWVTEVIASTVQFLDRKAGESNLQNTQNASMEGFGSQVMDNECPF